MEAGNAVPSPRVSTEKNALDSCLIDGDIAAVSRNRQRSRKAFGMSIIIEIVTLAALVTTPLMKSIAQPKLASRTFIPFVFGVTHSHLAQQHPTNPIHPPAIRSLVSAITYSVKGTPPRPTPTPVDATKDTLSEDEVSVGVSGAGLLQIVGLKPTAPAEPSHRNVDKTTGDKFPVKLSGALVQAQLISRVEPKYPPLAITTRTQGVVILRAIISREGSITELEVVSGHPLLIQAALDAVKQWRYRPTLLHEQPVEVETTITVIFQLRQ